MPGTPGQGARTSRYREVERKFEVEESTALPSFCGVAGLARVDRLPARSLDAIYLDTPAQELAAKRITLRRRTGGTDSGWHLKLPAGPDTRTEMRAPLGDVDDRAPTELLDAVLAVVRDRPLGPVARITTSRDIQLLHDADGSVLAEFCDDRVTASALGTPDVTAHRWREWEIELVGPGADPALLDRLSSRLLDAGAAPARYGSKLARALGATSSTDAGAYPDPLHQAVAEQVDELLVWDRAVREDADDAVHQMRVSIRKIRSLLQTSADTFALSGDAWILSELRWLAGLLGVARDAEVLAQRFRRELDGLPATLVRGRATERLVDSAIRRYQAGRNEALIAMRAPRYFRLLDGIDALVAKSPAGGHTGVSTAPETIDAAYRRVAKAARGAARAADDTGRDEALHRIRKAAKRLRYTAAAMGTPQVEARAKVIQTLLGDHQDSVVSRTHLLQQAVAAHSGGEDTFTYGLLYQREDDLARSCRAQLDRALTELAETVRTR